MGGIKALSNFEILYVCILEVWTQFINSFYLTSRGRAARILLEYLQRRASLNSLIFLETFLAPTFHRQILWLWFPRIEISCSPLVIAEVRQLSVWYWAQFQSVVNLFSLFFVIFVAFDYQNCFRFARLHKFNATHCRVVLEFSCLVNEFEIPFHFVVSHLAFTFDFHTWFSQKTHAAKMICVAFLNCVYLFN